MQYLLLVNFHLNFSRYENKETNGPEADTLPYSSPTSIIFHQHPVRLYDWTTDTCAFVKKTD